MARSADGVRGRSASRLQRRGRGPCGRPGDAWLAAADPALPEPAVSAPAVPKASWADLRGCQPRGPRPPRASDPCASPTSERRFRYDATVRVALIRRARKSRRIRGAPRPATRHGRPRRPAQARPWQSGDQQAGYTLAPWLTSSVNHALAPRTPPVSTCARSIASTPGRTSRSSSRRRCSISIRTNALTVARASRRARWKRFCARRDARKVEELHRGERRLFPEGLNPLRAAFVGYARSGRDVRVAAPTPAPTRNSSISSDSVLFDNRATGRRSRPSIAPRRPATRRWPRGRARASPRGAADRRVQGRPRDR